MEKEKSKNSELVLELAKAMAAKGLPYALGKRQGAAALKYPSTYNYICVVVEHDGALEIIGGPRTDLEKEEDAPAWPLSVAEALHRIAVHYKFYSPK